MLTPDLTYSFRMPKDTSGPTFEVLTRASSQAATNATLTFTMNDMAKDKMFVLSNITCVASPGATQAPLGIVVTGSTQAGLAFEIVRINALAVADQNMNLNWQGQVFLMGGGPGTLCVSVVASFDAGVASNSLTLGIHGVVIPRANAAAF